MTNRPILFFAFANDYEGKTGYLRHLPAEINGLKKTLDAAQNAGLCEAILLTNATLDQITEVFQNPKNRSRIAVFHFSGHAGSLELMLENERSQAAERIDSAGFVPFLASQPNLQLVFLNGCFAQRQASELSERGVPAVVGTHAAVDDRVATELSIAFYKGLGAGLDLETAWREAVLTLRAKRFFEKNDSATRAIGSAQIAENQRFPWEIIWRTGSEAVKNWNLPEATANPLFGLPPLPSRYELPDEPFRFLRRFEATDAAVFFGRGRFVRALYQRVTSENGSPVMLLFGQSGVGKSSLLNAGLLPRLEADFDVVYLRRDRDEGLSGGLRRALGLPGETAVSDFQKSTENNIRQLELTLPNLTEPAHSQVVTLIRILRETGLPPSKSTPNPTPNDPDLAARWQAREQASGGRPFVLILDQAEEFFTRPNEQQPRELDDFLKNLQHIFADPATRPKGKLILSYRKEYDPEFEKVFAQFRIPRERVFLEKLNREDIVEIVSGLTSTEALRNKYGLKIEDKLPVVIADDLLADRDSPVAPMLQIILSKLWKAQQSKPAPHFLLAEYQFLIKKGILLGDFFEEQMAAIQEWEQALHNNASSSGLALDLLHYHTTPLGTAESRDFENLRQIYQHQADVLQKLVVKFQELYLLADTDDHKTALAHDTLAPVVQKKMRQSDKPGQRALRILEAKTTDYELNPTATFIEEDDLALVENGSSGMRLWMPKERELIEKSRQRRLELQAERSRNRRFRQMAVVLIALAAVVATGLWRVAEKRRFEVETSNLYNEGRLELASDPTTGLAKMTAALDRDPADTTRQKGVAEARRENLFYEILLQKPANSFTAAAFSPEKTGFALAEDKQVSVFRVGDISAFRQLPEARNGVFSIIFQNENIVWTGAADRLVYRFDAANNRTDPQPELTSGARVLAFSEKRKLLAVGQQTPFLHLLDLNSTKPIFEKMTADANENDGALPAPIAALAFDPTGNALAAALDNGETLIFSTADRSLRQTLAGRPAAARAIGFSPDGSTAVIGFADGMIHFLKNDSTSGLLQLRDSLRLQEVGVSAVAFSPDGHFLLAGFENGQGRIVDLHSRAVVFSLLGHRGRLISAGFSVGSDSIFTASADGSLRRWVFPNPYPRLSVQTEALDFSALRFTPDGRHVVAASGGSWLEIFETKNLRPVGRYEGHSTDLKALAVSPDGRKCASGDAGGNVHVWDFETRKSLEIKNLGGDSMAVSRLRFSPDGLRLLVGLDGGRTFFLWTSGQAAVPFDPAANAKGSVVDLGFSTDGQRIFAATTDSAVVVWPLSSLGSPQVFRLPGAPTQFVFSEKNAAPGVLLDKGGIVFFEKNELWKRLPAHETAIFSADGSTYLTRNPSGDGCLQLRFLPLGFERRGLRFPGGCDFSAVDFSAEGGWVAAGLPGGKLVVWPALF